MGGPSIWTRVASLSLLKSDIGMAGSKIQVRHQPELTVAIVQETDSNVGITLKTNEGRAVAICQQKAITNASAIVKW